MAKTVKIRIKSGSVPDYLTKNKIYEAETLSQATEYGGLTFVFTDDDGNRIGVNQKNSAHLNGGEWELVS